MTDAFITQDEVKELFDYDAETGNLVYRKTFKGRKYKNGTKVAGTIQPNGYRMVMIKRKRYYIHRLIWLWHHGTFPRVTDHINQDKSDNRIENLRAVDYKQNRWNIEACKTTSVTGYKGVCYIKDRGKYLAYTGEDYKMNYIGLYDTPEEAAKAYNEKILSTRGEFANLNMIPDNNELPEWLK